jgi:hypothetical protein
MRPIATTKVIGYFRFGRGSLNIDSQGVDSIFAKEFWPLCEKIEQL